MIMPLGRRGGDHARSTVFAVMFVIIGERSTPGTVGGRGGDGLEVIMSVEVIMGVMVVVVVIVIVMMGVILMMAVIIVVI